MLLFQATQLPISLKDTHSVEQTHAARQHIYEPQVKVNAVLFAKVTDFILDWPFEAQ